MTKYVTILAILTLAGCGPVPSEMDPAQLVTKCENGALKGLKSPSTASFNAGNDYLPNVKKFPDGHFEVLDWVDSQNSFGAMVRSNVSCYLIVRSDSTVRLMRVEIDGEQIPGFGGT